MIKTLCKPVLIAFFVLAIGISGCSTAGTKKGSDYTVTFKTAQEVGKVWKTGIEVLPEIRYSAVSTSATSGLIFAEQANGKNQAAHLNIRVSRASGATLVIVDYTGPAGTPVDHSAADQFVAALKKRIPDLEPAKKN